MEENFKPIMKKFCDDMGWIKLGLSSDFNVLEFLDKLD
jgi:hypothetical protein